MDVSQTTVPDSSQVNAEDFLAGPRTVTVAGVRQGNSEQPVNIDLVEFPGRAYRPSKSMRRVLVMCWGKDSDTYAGRRLTLYRDPDVKFGRDTPGGIKISNLSHIDRAVTMALTVTRGKREPHTVQPLPQSPQGESPRGATQGGRTPGAGKVEVAGVAASSTPPPADPLKEIGRLMKLADITERAHATAYVTDVIGREVASTKDLTDAEKDTLIESLRREVGEA